MKPKKSSMPTIYKDIKDCNLVIELRDIRIPISSSVRFLHSKFATKPKVIFLTKADLVSKKYAQKVIRFFAKQNIKAYAIQSVGFKRKLLSYFSMLQKDFTPKNSLLKVFRVVIVGLPNVGKSTLINAIRGKKVAKAANSPGITKGRQWIKITKECYLLDTPGVATLTQTMDQDLKMKFAACRMIGDNIYDKEELAFWLFKMFSERKDVDCLFPEDKFPFKEDWDEFVENIATRHELLKRGGLKDVSRAACRWVDLILENYLDYADLDEIEG